MRFILVCKLKSIHDGVLSDVSPKMVTDMERGQEGDGVSTFQIE